MTPTETTVAAETAAPPAIDPAALQAQIDELKEQVAEQTRTAQFWADKARAASNGNGHAPAAPAAEEEPDVLEAITTGGAKGFDELAAKRGFVRKTEVERMIDAKANQVTREQQLMTEYPDLKNKNSEFFKGTAVRYGQLVTEGMAQHLAMETAARETELNFLRSGKMKLPGAEPTKAEKEAERLRRIDAQGGEGGRRRPAAAAEDDEELTAEQKHIADAMGISHEAYMKRAKAGVQRIGGGR